MLVEVWSFYNWKWNSVWFLKYRNHNQLLCLVYLKFEAKTIIGHAIPPNQMNVIIHLASDENFGSKMIRQTFLC